MDCLYKPVVLNQGARLPGGGANKFPAGRESFRPLQHGKLDQ